MKLFHLLALGMFVAFVGAGCASAPYGMSLDRHNFGSTQLRPARVLLVDVTDGETVWSMDVPVGKTLVVDLHQPTTWTQSTWTGAEPADRMTWGLFDTGTTFGSLEEEVELSGNPVKLELEYREIEEPEIRDATFTPIEEPPLPDEELERAPTPEGEQSPEAEVEDNA